MLYLIFGYGISSKGASPFSSMGDITVGVAKLLDGLNFHKASGPDELNARVLTECSNEISPILALIYNESLARRCTIIMDISKCFSGL